MAPREPQRRYREDQEQDLRTAPLEVEIDDEEDEEPPPWDPDDLPDDYREHFAGNSKFFNQTDIPGKGLDAEMVVTIDNVKRGRVKSDGKWKNQFILTFEGIDKQFGANPTNCDLISHIYGSSPRRWAGKSITLYRTKTKFKGQSVLCVRVRPVPPRGARRPAAKAKPAAKRRVA